jgi:hypothetical protein
MGNADQADHAEFVEVRVNDRLERLWRDVGANDHVAFEARQ